MADKFNDFAKIDHPRGLIYDQGHLWVLHPPTLSLLIDKDGDGVSDQQKTLISNISTDQVNERGADHTTNGIRMGIDGWIYIAVGDFGFVNATGTDGRSLSRRGGGIVRVRPDGTDMEVYSWGQRNILDVCIDPQLNMFNAITRTMVVVERARGRIFCKVPTMVTLRSTSTLQKRLCPRWQIMVVVQVVARCTCTTRAGQSNTATPTTLAIGELAKSIDTRHRHGTDV